jgi:hypothetical protein
VVVVVGATAALVPHACAFSTAHSIVSPPREPSDSKTRNVILTLLHIRLHHSYLSVVGEGLSKHFTEVTATVVDSPDFREPPFHLASEGICGSPRLADVGGPPYLVPVVQRSKVILIVFYLLLFSSLRTSQHN